MDILLVVGVVLTLAGAAGGLWKFYRHWRSRRKLQELRRMWPVLSEEAKNRILARALAEAGQKGGPA
jgi:type II secretory pathway component PulM